MKRLTITDKKLIDALRRMAPETGSLICLGCGYERRCSVYGCAVLQTAVGRLEELTAPQPNAPLTLEELREMDGEPVWVVSHSIIQKKLWAIVNVSPENKSLYVENRIYTFYSNFYKRQWLAYRRKPEKGTA